MLIFRSEEHLERWLEQGSVSGEKLSVEQQWTLAQRWFRGRHLPDWEPRNAEQAEAVFRSVGLTSDFWRLASDR
jgi:hypothetical protein